MESRRGLANEGSDGSDSFVGKHHVLQRVADACGGFEAAALRQTDFHGEAIALSHRHHLHIEGKEHQHTEGDGTQSQADGEMRVLEAMALHFVVKTLQEVEKPHLGFQKTIASGLVGFGFDEHDFQRGDDEHGVSQ